MAELTSMFRQMMKSERKRLVPGTIKLMLRDGETVTRLENLTKYEYSKLAQMAKEYLAADPEMNECLFIDCTRAVFDHVLDYIISDREELPPASDELLRAKVESQIKRLGLDPS